MSLLVVCPSRSRPFAALDAFESFQITHELEDSTFMVVADSDDPKVNTYQHVDIPLSVLEPKGGMVATLNYVVEYAMDRYDFVGFIGDDHRFRTPGWDAKFTEVLRRNGGGFAYGNDLFWPKGEIPTQIVISTNILRHLGWMGLPGCQHLYIDNAWRELGEATDSLFYFPNYIIEHLHPAAGKASWDEQYQRLNSEARYAADRQAFETWMATQAPEDIERVRCALSCSPLS